MNDVDANVVTLPIGDHRREHNLRESEIAELPISQAPFMARTRACQHAHSVVDAKARTVTCDSCGVVLDPIAVLDRIAHDFAEPLRQAQRARQRYLDLQADIQRLEREERNAKARVRSARKRALTFDADALEAALVEHVANQRWRAEDFHSMSEARQDAIRQAAIPLIETYIGVLNIRKGARP